MNSSRFYVWRTLNGSASPGNLDADLSKRSSWSPSATGKGTKFNSKLTPLIDSVDPLLNVPLVSDTDSKAVD